MAPQIITSEKLTDSDINELLDFKQKITDYDEDDVNEALRLYALKRDSNHIDQIKIQYLNEKLKALQSTNITSLVLLGLFVVTIIVCMAMY